PPLSLLHYPYIFIIFSLFSSNRSTTLETYTLSYTTLFRSGTYPRLVCRRSDRSPDANRARSWHQPRALQNAWNHEADPGAHKTSDRKSTRLNSSHQIISYAVFCMKKKNKHDLYVNLPKLQR